VVTPRRVIACPGGLRIDLRGIGGPGTERSAALLEERLSALPGVERAEVNGRLGCVFVGCDPEAVDREELLEIARELDEQERHAHETPVRVVEEHIRSIIRLATGVAGVGTIFTGIALRAPRLSPAVPALVNLLNATPVLREELDKRIGRGPANALFHTANLVTQTLTLRPLGLVAHSMAALRRYAEDFARHHGIAGSVQVVGDETTRLPPALETTLYRVTQEALTNVARHSRARHFGIVLDLRGPVVRLVIEDDGCGFDPSAPREGTGLTGIAERLALVHGHMTIESSPESGTTLFVSVPLEREEEEHAHPDRG
ncbi:MAG: hypothetical protein LOD90_10205, partial [Symbiobacteriaceae bacterium]